MKKLILMVAFLVAMVFVLTAAQNCWAGDISGKLAQIKTGETSEAEVKAILGPPANEKEETIKPGGVNIHLPQMEKHLKTLYYNDDGKEIRVVIDMTTGKVKGVRH